MNKQYLHFGEHKVITFKKAMLLSDRVLNRPSSTKVFNLKILLKFPEMGNYLKLKSRNFFLKKIYWGISQYNYFKLRAHGQAMPLPFILNLLPLG